MLSLFNHSDFLSLSPHITISGTNPKRQFLGRKCLLQLCGGGENSSRALYIQALYHFVFIKDGLTKIYCIPYGDLQCDIDYTSIMRYTLFLNQNGPLKLSQQIECGGDNAICLPQLVARSLRLSGLFLVLAVSVSLKSVDG